MTSNRSFSSPLKYNIQIARLPNVTFFTQTANIPGITLGRAPEGTPFTRLYMQGDHVDYSTFDITFKLDEKFDNWFEIHSWMTGIGFPRKREEYADLKKGVIKNLDNKDIVPANKKETNRKTGDIYSQITLSVFTSHNNSIVEVHFVDAYPIALSPIELSTKSRDVEYLTAHASFSYTYYNINRP